MKITKTKLGEACYFESLKMNFIKTIIKELYYGENNYGGFISLKHFEFEYDNYQARIAFINDIMEAYNWDSLLDNAYSMFGNDYGSPYYRIYEAKSGIVWLVKIEGELPFELSDHFNITKQELEQLRNGDK